MGNARLILLTVVLAACSSQGAGRSTGTGTVSGDVLAGPTCPVERPGDPDCLPVAVDGMVNFVQNDEIVASQAIDTTGHYALDLAPGSYTVRVDVGEAPFPSCPSLEVVVEQGAESTINIDCDTGIR
jgi:hypothetical protein